MNDRPHAWRQAYVAGLNCALHLPKSKSVLVICKGTPDKSDSYLAQGGICRLQGESEDEDEKEFIIDAANVKSIKDKVIFKDEKSKIRGEHLRLGKPVYELCAPCLACITAL